jgi:hypothetical protein
MARSNIQPVDAASTICAFGEQNFHTAFQFPGTAPAKSAPLIRH